MLLGEALIDLPFLFVFKHIVDLKCRPRERERERKREMHRTPRARSGISKSGEFDPGLLRGQQGPQH